MPTGFSDHELRDAGFLPGLPASSTVFGPVDKPERFFPREHQPDDIWEEADGVRSKYQPSTLLLMSPLLERPFNDWQLGLHEMTEAAVEKRSNFEVEALLQLMSTRARKMFPKKENDG